jgi:ArsR family transcriptional regulator
MSTRLRPSGCCTDIVSSTVCSADEQTDQVNIFKALADSTRYEIFRLVAAQTEPICACDVVEQFQVSQPTISHHMKVLRDAGLISVSRRGVWAYYAVDPRGLARLQYAVTSFEPANLVAAG